MQLKNILGFAVGPVATAALGLITLPIIAWIFPPPDLGRLNVLQISISFFLLLSVLGLDQAYVREYHEVTNKKQLLKLCFLPGFVFLCGLAVIGVALAEEFSSLLYSDSDPRLFWMTLAAFFISYISRFLSLILRMQERGWAYSASQVLPKIVQLLLVVSLALTAYERNFLLLHGVVLCSLFTVLLCFVWNARAEWAGAFAEKTDFRQLKQLFKFGLPLVFSGLTYWGLAATSTIALRLWSPLDELAVYSVAKSFAGAAFVFQSVFTVVWAPVVYKWVAEGADMRIVESVTQQALAVVCVIIALSGTLSWICDLLLPNQYSAVKYILLCLLIQPLLYTLSEVTCVGIAITRRTVYSIVIAVAALLVNLILSYVLVPSFGAAGAASANAIAFAVFFVARTEVSVRIWRLFPRTKLYVSTLLLLGGTLVTASLGFDASNAVHVAWFFVLLFCVLFFNKEWTVLYQALRARKL